MSIFCQRVEDYIDPGLVYWERKEKEEKKAGEEKPSDFSMPGTSSDGVLSEDKRKFMVQCTSLNIYFST